MGSGTDRRYDLNDLNDLNDRPGITPRSGSGAMRGIVMMLAASLLVTANDALVKLALGAAGSAEVLFFRGLFALLALLIYAAISGQFGCLLPRCWRLSVGLAGLAVLSLFLFTYALNFMTLAAAVMLAYLSPIFVALLAPLMLDETIGRHQWLAVIISFIGVGLITTPEMALTGDAARWVLVLPVLVAVIIALRDLITRQHIGGEHVLALSVMVQVMSVAAAGLAFSPEWLAPPPRQLALYALCGVIVTAGAAGMIAALQHGTVTSLSTLKYSCVVWAALIGWLVFAEPLSLSAMAGGALIIGGGALSSASPACSVAACATPPAARSRNRPNFTS